MSNLEALKKVSSILNVKSANEWIDESKHQETPKMLFSEFWHEGELSFLFADSNTGKSILAVQIANSISKGIPVDNFKLEAPKQTVLYFDFELTPKQFEIRYSCPKTDKSHPNKYYNFNDNLKRIEINNEFIVQDPKGFLELLKAEIERCIKQTGAKVVVVDNLTYLNNDNENAKNATPLMQGLKSLKNKYDLSMLILGHTPKLDPTKPITKNSLAGSKMLMNFVDSSFAINSSSKDKNYRYIKQIKARNTGIVYDADNVAVCMVNKSFNFLGFQFIEYDDELKHLKEQTLQDKELKKQEALSLKQQGMSNVEIGRQFGVSEGAVRKWLKKE